MTEVNIVVSDLLCCRAFGGIDGGTLRLPFKNHLALLLLPALWYIVKPALISFMTLHSARPTVFDGPVNNEWFVCIKTRLLVLNYLLPF
jgi:hypothetical protein